MLKNLFLVFIILFVCSRSNGEELFHNIHKNYYVNKNLSRTISVGLVLINLEQYHNILEPKDMIYNQVLSYSKDKPFGDKHGRSTNIHETVHGINNVLRNTYKKNLKKDVNAFYAEAGYGIVIENPKLTIRDIIPYIPNVVRGYRYNLYFVKQLGDWNDVPTYPIDEWSAYIAGAECAVDDKQQGIDIPKSDYVSGALEFSIYCTALAIAVKHKDPEYWKNNDHFKNTIQYFLIKAEKTFSEGCDQFPSDQQDQLLDNLRNHKDTEYLRQFLLTEFQGIFVD